MYLGMRAEGMTRALAFASLKRMGYKRRIKTLDKHARRIEATGQALLGTENVRGMAALNELEMRFLKQWVLMKNADNEDFDLREVQRTIKRLFNKDVCISTCSNNLRRLGMSQKTCQSKTPGCKKLNAELVDEYWDFICKLKKEKLLNVHPSKIRSIDVTYSRKPVTAIKTFSGRGSGKQKSVKKVKLFTDAIVTMISADGKNHTKSHLYTHNPRMAPTQRNTDRGRVIRAEFDEALKRYDVEEDRVHFVKSKRNYRGECAEMYEDFLSRHKVEPDTLILHDRGNAFKRQKVSIFETMGFTNHEEYPSDVHQYLSPNDNKLHGCKAAWYREYYKFENDVSAPLRLMQLIDLDTVKNSKRYFDTNIIRVKKSQIDHIVST